MRGIESERLPIKAWARGVDETEAVFGQARNLANHPLARLWVCLMPHYHVGMPIGGVLATGGRCRAERCGRRNRRRDDRGAQ